MRVGIMQPYFLPYIGYFQLINLCDKFVIYDDIQFTKRGWINRNRILADGEPRMFSLPIRKGSDYLDVRERWISDEFKPNKMLNLLRESYRRAPCWSIHEEQIGEILRFPDLNLFNFLANSLVEICRCLKVETRLVISSTLDLDPSLRGAERVIATCQAVGATEYVNPIGGIDLYSKALFAQHGLELSFLEAKLSPYSQGDLPFVEGLSIVDAMAFVEPEELRSRVVSDYVVSSRTSATE